MADEDGSPVDSTAAGSDDGAGGVPGTSNRIWPWLKASLTDLKSWTIFLGFLGLLSFAMVRFFDLLIYGRFGLVPDEVGRDYQASIVAAVPMAVALAIFALGGAYLGSQLSDLFSSVGKRGEHPTGSSSVNAIVVVAAVLGMVAVSYLFVWDTGRNISECKREGSIDRLVYGWVTAPVLAIDPPVNGLTDKVAYLGTGSTHAVLYDCTEQRIVRLPKSKYVIVTDPRPPGRSTDDTPEE
jgi:hypothetical protein